MCVQPCGSDSVFVNHPQSFTQALRTEFVICTASCMQINQPKMKTTEQSTKHHSQGYQPTATSRRGTPRLGCRGTWDPDAVPLLFLEPAPINACGIYFIKTAASTGKDFLCKKDAGMFGEKGAKYSSEIVPSIQIHSPWSYNTNFVSN